MGIHNSPENCFLFDVPTKNIETGIDEIEYSINYNNSNFNLTFDWNYKNSDFIEKNKYILKGLLLNNKFPFKNDNTSFEISLIEKIINDQLLINTPKNKLDNLLLYFYKQQSFDGAEIILYPLTSFTLFKLYFKNVNEFDFYMNTLRNLGFISYSSTMDGKYDLFITYEGLEYIIKIEDEGPTSTKCFIAMSFSEEAKPIRESIKNAIIKCGYQPILIDEVDYDSDLTINDAMVGFIRKCKFVIADFTHHKNGVYFEAGFALGLKKPVIYTCHNDDFGKTHFDTNHYPHIVYENYETLEKRLIDKINAWIL